MRSEVVDAPLDDLRRGEMLELSVQLGQLFVAVLRQARQWVRFENHVAHSDSPVSATYGPVSS